MKNFLFIIAFLIVLTSIIVGINPQMHKTLIIGKSDLAITNQEIVKSESSIEFSNKDAIIDKNKTSFKSVDSIKDTDNIDTQSVDTFNNFDKLIKLQEQEEQSKKVQADVKKKADNQAKKLAQQKAQEQARLAQQKAQAEAKKKAEEQAKLAQQKAAEQAKLAKQKAEAEAKRKAEELAKKQAEEQRKIVEYQENILWNQWHVEVNRAIASKTGYQLANIAPPRTIYLYSFDVDNKRRVSNISVRISRGYSNTTTQQGLYMIQDAIQSLNLSTILQFPSGSQRTTVKVSSGIETTTSSPTVLNASSFNDVEVIKKQRYE